MVFVAPSPSDSDLAVSSITTCQVLRGLESFARDHGRETDAGTMTAMKKCQIMPCAWLSGTEVQRLKPVQAPRNLSSHMLCAAFNPAVPGAPRRASLTCCALSLVRTSESLRVSWATQQSHHTAPMYVMTVQVRPHVSSVFTSRCHSSTASRERCE